MLEKDSATYYYVCEDGAYNANPCPIHFPGATSMPDDWESTYVPPVPPEPTPDPDPIP